MDELAEVKTPDHLVDILSVGNEDIEKLEGHLLALAKENRIQDFVAHYFTPGMYHRYGFYPKGSVVIGHKHKEETVNVLLRGKITVLIDGVVHHVSAPFRIISAPGVRKVAYMEEDVVWVNSFVTDLNEVPKLEEFLIEKSQTFLQYEAREDYDKFLKEYGFTPEAVAGFVENTEDLIDFPLETHTDVRDSKIHGKGLFSTIDVEAGFCFGAARYLGRRTPAGRYTNHSPSPNAEMVPDDFGGISLVTTKPIAKDEEITVDYRKCFATATEADKILISNK
jgi:hypothetical protein